MIFGILETYNENTSIICLYKLGYELERAVPYDSNEVLYA